MNHTILLIQSEEKSYRQNHKKLLNQMKNIKLKSNNFWLI